METTIATMLRDFEDGRMSRRQLIQSLAMVALAGGAASAQTPSAPAPAPFVKTSWKTVHLDHISFAVTDYKKSAAFYQALMGWELQNDNGTNQATLRIGNVGEIIIRNSRVSAAAAAAPGSAPAVAGAQGNRPPVTGVINHISWGVEPWDTDGVKAALEKRGLEPRPDMVGADFKSYHVTDPDGWDLQISNQTKIG